MPMTLGKEQRRESPPFTRGNNAGVGLQQEMMNLVMRDRGAKESPDCLFLCDHRLWPYSSYGDSGACYGDGVFPYNERHAFSRIHRR